MSGPGEGRGIGCEASGRPGLAEKADEAQCFDRAMRREAFALLLECFRMVSSLETLELVIQVERLGKRFGRLSYSSHCEVALDRVPSRLMLPGLDQRAAPLDFVQLFLVKGGHSDALFASSLGQYFNDVWPGCDDYAHLFGGVGLIRLSRAQAEVLMQVLNGESFDEKLDEILTA